MSTMNYFQTNLFYFLSLFVTFSSSGQGKILSVEKEKIDAYVQHIQKRHEVPGVSLAIIQKGQVVYKENFGKASIEHNSPIIDQSIFRAYSLTKPIVSVAVFQLIEQGKLSLEDTIEKYVKDLPEPWRKTQIKHLLTHSSGLPDMA